MARLVRVGSASVSLEVAFNRVAPNLNLGGDLDPALEFNPG